MANELAGRHVAILATDGFEQSELTEPRKALPAAGAEWVDQESGGGNKSGAGRGHAENHASSQKGGKIGGKAAASRTAAERSASARKAAATRKRNAEHHAH